MIAKHIVSDNLLVIICYPSWIENKRKVKLQLRVGVGKDMAQHLKGGYKP